ncbi:MAG TPA: hypothetical protein VMR34_05315 [Candidatus Saccharimonadales bacterium]|nr:hypothetical protein [Candidatus Saccharimonadales bacterium]
MNRLPRQAIRKVPEITALFWITKLLTTAMGEATSDFLVFRINPYFAVSLGGVALLIALILQFSVRKYIPWVYWLTVAMVAVFGTMAADVLHIQFGIPYIETTIFFAIILIIVFIVWHKSEKTLSIHSIYTPRREMFYWATVMATFALGTAAGDLTATTIGLGYFSSALLFSGVIIVPAVGYWLFRLNQITAFWLAYILTRPIGASFADWTSKAHTVGGLAFGDGHVSFFLTAIIIVFVAYMSISKREVKRERSRI